MPTLPSTTTPFSLAQVFSWKGSLALHQDRIHKMPDSYQCPVEDCYKTFSYKHVLQQHLRRVHKLDSINN